MRVLHIGKYYPPVSGGMETVLATLCRREQAVLETRALVVSRCARTVHQIVEGVPVTRVGSIATIGSVSVAPTLPLWLMRTRADVMVLHEPNPMALVAYFIARPSAPLVVWYHSEVIRPHWRYRLFYHPFLEYALRRAERIIVSSPPMLDVPALGRYREKCAVVPYGIETNRYTANPGATAKAQEMRERCRRPILLFVGRLVPYKGVDILLRALPGVDAEAVIVGEGPARPMLEALANDLHIADRVNFVGAVSDLDVLAWFRACDALILPSITRQEAFGIVQLEAMLCGKPVVSTDVGTGAGWVNQHNRTGLVVRAGDVAALHQALARLISDQSFREKLGAQARIRVMSQFTAGQMSRAALAIYQQVCSTRSVMPPEPVRSQLA